MSDVENVMVDTAQEITELYQLLEEFTIMGRKSPQRDGALKLG